MRDDSRQRADLITHLESAIALAAELSVPMTRYLADCALLDAREQMRGLEVPVKMAAVFRVAALLPLSWHLVLARHEH